MKRSQTNGCPSSGRVAGRLKEILEKDPVIDSQRAVLYTQYMKTHWRENRFIRAGGALRHILSRLTARIWDEELIVGNISRYFRGSQVYPEYETWMIEAFHQVRREEERYIEGSLPQKQGERLGIYRIFPEDRKKIQQVAAFWKRKNWRRLAENCLKRTKYDFNRVEKWMQQLVFLRFMFDVPEGRVIVDYRKVIDIGIKGIVAIIDGKIAGIGDPVTPDQLEKYHFYRGMKLALEGIVCFARNHAREARRLASETDDPLRKAELLEIARICRKVPFHPAASFHEAIQSFWFTHVCLFIELNGSGISPGRFDQYMFKSFRHDMDAGKITEQRALELLELLRIKCSEITRSHATFTEAYRGGSTFQNLTLGGCDSNGNPCDNELSMLVLQAGINVRTWQPTISVRWRKDMSPVFKTKIVEAIKAGSGYPALFNDELATRRFLENSSASLTDARDWAPCGCVDMQICGKRMPMYAIPHTNNLKILELVLNRGINPVTGDRLLDVAIDPEKATFEEIIQETIRLTDLIIRQEATYWNTIMLVHNDMGLVHPFMTALLDDCIETGKDAYEGGCRYNDSAYVISCGMVNVANSLAAIKQVVFDERIVTMNELLNALNQNFSGHDFLQKKLLNAPKYGNDDDRVDAIAARLYLAWSESAQKINNWLDKPWRPSTLSVTTQVLMGKACGATPDGRTAGEFLADGALSAFPGSDVSGPTSLIKSAAKINAGKLQSTLFNMKFNPLAIEGIKGSEKFIRLNDTYFDLGGYQIQYNIIDRKILLDAQKNPEKYSDLMIRVAGFTARFVELGPDVQRQIIERTQFTDL